MFIKILTDKIIPLHFYLSLFSGCGVSSITHTYTQINKKFNSLIPRAVNLALILSSPRCTCSTLPSLNCGVTNSCEFLRTPDCHWSLLKDYFTEFQLLRHCYSYSLGETDWIPDGPVYNTLTQSTMLDRYFYLSTNTACLIGANETILHFHHARTVTTSVCSLQTVQSTQAIWVIFAIIATISYFKEIFIK